jgi:hypothetical protein
MLQAGVEVDYAAAFFAFLFAVICILVLMQARRPSNKLEIWNILLSYYI